MLKTKQKIYCYDQIAFTLYKNIPYLERYFYKKTQKRKQQLITIRFFHNTKAVVINSALKINKALFVLITKYI